MRNSNACWFCGKPGTPTALGTILCPEHDAQCDDYNCVQCNVRCYAKKDTPHSNVCSTCVLRNQAKTLLSPAQMEQIVSYVEAKRIINAIIMVRETLDWSLRDSMDFVEAIRQDLYGI